MSAKPKCRMLVYQTDNIGDIIQAIALSRLLPQAQGLMRDSFLYDQRPDLPTVVHGFLYKPLRKRLGDNCLFAGVHLYAGTPVQDFLPWLMASPWPVGVRDPWTEGKLRGAGFENVVMVGCPTVTLPRYEGPRKGEYAVDADGPGERLSHGGWEKKSVTAQWEAALGLMKKYRSAKLVTTNRLHVALPCLAYGTPVRIVWKHVWQDVRLSILRKLGVKDGEVSAVNLKVVADRYRAFIKQHLKMLDGTGEPKLPVIERA